MATGLSIPISAAGAQHGALLQRGMRWMEMQWTPILAQLAGGIVGALLAWKGGFGYWALVVQAWVGAVVSTALLWYFARWRPDFTPHWRHARSALHFGLNLTGFSFINYFHRQFDNVLVGWRWGATSLGYYNNAYSLLTLPLTLISSPMASAVVPALSRLQHDPERWNRAFLRAFGALNLISAGLTTMLIVSAEPLVRIVYGAQWHESGKIFALLAISMFAATPVNATGWIYISLGQTNRMLRWSMIVTPFYIAAFFVGLPFGPRGVAICYSIVMCLACAPYLAYATAHSPTTFGSVLKVSAPPAFVGASIVLSETLFHWIPVSSYSFIQIVENSLCVGCIYVLAVSIYLTWVKSMAPVKNDFLASIMNTYNQNT
jgi:PST family polysaccharide transporter